jgi:phosphate transport system substrate-binding protein
VNLLEFLISRNSTATVATCSRAEVHMKLRLFFVPLLAAFALVGCNSGTTASAAYSSAHVTGAGSSFVYPVMMRWVQAYQQNSGRLEINYQSIGSGGGIEELKKGVLDFAASDAAVNDEKLKEMPALVQIPESAGPVCITYNLEQIKEPLKLSAKTLSDIYLGTIKNWQDAAIKNDNPGVNLPKQNILVVYRTDGSGTTNIFTTYLAAVSPKWKSHVGQGLSVSWPIGLGGKGSEGVTGVVKQISGAIGYVELTYAEENNLPVAQVQNAAGKYVSPTAAGTSAAIDAFSGELAKDVRTPIVNAPASAPDAYPISGLTFLLVPKQAKDDHKARAVKGFVQYIITDGQNPAEQLHYAKIPVSLQQIDQQLLQQVQGGS